MKPINLLPQKHRARSASGAHEGGAYVVLGVLGALLLALLLYVLTVNGINSNTEQLTRVNNEATEAEMRAAKLGSFGSFAQIKATRVQSVKALADVRFDWERLMRELARVTPKDVYLRDLEAAVKPPEQGSAPASTTGAVTGGPVLALKGCARRQPDVAVTLVRLKSLHRSKEVTLVESARDKEAATAGVVAVAGAAAASGENDKCVLASGGNGYKFEAKVEFEQLAPTLKGGGRNLPASLGGGA